MSDVPAGFVLDVAEYESLSISVEESGVAHVTTTAHDGESSISFDVVASLAHSHGLVIVGGVGFFDDGRVLVKVAPEGWQSGGGGE